MICPKDKGEGLEEWEEIRNGKSTISGKKKLIFLEQEKTKNGHLSLMQQRFTFPHDFRMEKRFGKTNSAFTQQQASKTIMSLNLLGISPVR